ncbi:MAG TPA: indolepyruvate ferredoxin oxidoreductase family protein, partial [Solirubrobacterales bacterium]|nr:indolepyruvate ferredoxin oxidoreductase family protein [Solirubrobacterales bacterium]
MSGLPVMSEVSLNDKYVADSGTVLISGVQALVRLVLEQRRLDEARGLDTAAFVSGYQGSPLGGFDRELQRAGKYLDALGVVFQPGLNEELGATAVAGTQLIGELELRRHEGIVGFWYGKNPGLDRAADAIRHGNVSGTAPLGGAVALVGDDPSCKSSTIPSSCEPICRSLIMPVLAPGTVRELLDFGLHAVALSRASGLWVAVKVVADIADASATVELDGIADRIPVPETRPFKPPILLAASSLDAERDQLGSRLDRALAYIRAAGLNEIVFEPSRPRLTVVAAGVAHEAVVRALADLGVGDAELERIGLRLAKVAMPWPLDPAFVAELAAGVEEVLVIEDKLPFLESQIKEMLYGGPQTPRVVGGGAAVGEAVLSRGGGVSAEEVAAALAARLPGGALPGPAAAAPVEFADGSAVELRQLPARTPYFCSGCPHNRSTKAPDDSLVGVGI